MTGDGFRNSMSVLLVLAFGSAPALSQGAQQAPPPGRGQQAPAAAPAQQDFSTVTIVTTKITDRFYTLDGQGGRMAVQVGPEGIFVVDSQFAPLSERLIAAIRQVSPAPLRFLVNTHVHGDHTGGNANFGSRRCHDHGAPAAARTTGEATGAGHRRRPRLRRRRRRFPSSPMTAAPSSISTARRSS